MTQYSFTPSDLFDKGVWTEDAPDWMKPGARVAFPHYVPPRKPTLWERIRGIKPVAPPVTTWSYAMVDHDDFCFPGYCYPTVYDFAATSPAEAQAAIDVLIQAKGPCTLTPHPDGYYVVSW